MLSQRALIRFATPSPSSSLQQQRPSSSPRVLTFSCRNGNGNSSVAAATLKIPYRSSLGTEHVEYDRGSEFETPKQQDDKTEYNKEPEDEEEEEEDDDDETVGKVRVPRQKYIAVSKTELLEAIVTNLMADSTSDQVLQFRRLSSCLDSIFHAEHKQILEEMRNDYFQACYMDSEETTSEGSDRLDKNVAAKSCLDADFVNGVGSMVEDVREETELERHIPFNYSLDFKKNFSSPPQNVRSFSDEETRRASATRFQRSFMQLLSNAQFEELSARDLSLASSLNTDYLLTLPIYVDWKRAAEANAIIFRRGYATERQKGLLIVEKLDYLQSRLLQKIIFTLSKPLGKVCTWALNNATQKEEGQGLMKKVKLWLQQPYSVNGKSSNNFLRVDELAYRDLPIWLAAQRAVSRYEGFLSVTGPRGRLLRKFLIWTGLLSPAEEIQYELESDSNASESLSRPILLSRISLSDIWQPASRKSCGNDFWKRFKTSASILLSKSILQEPAFEELILLYTEDVGKSDNEVELPPLQLKVYERIPIPDLPVIFPHKKLSFRIIDSVRLDIATILGLLAYIINYKFEDIFFSPSAIVLDVIAISALVIFLTRVALGYKQTWDRYQLLVNKTLYEKTLASGFGSVHFLLDSSEQQQYKEAILAYAILLKEENGQVTCHQSVQEKCERFMFCVLKEKIEMPIDKAISTLSRLGLVTETTIGGKTIFQVVPSSAACEVLQRRWNNLFV